GQTGLGITSCSLRSGSNQLHGSVYEYLRNDALDSRGFFAPTTPINKQNEFGATAGGPIRKDKTFFFGWYHGFRLAKQASNALDTLLTRAMKSGDLSNILGPPISTCGTGSQACFDGICRPVYSVEICEPRTHG